MEPHPRERDLPACLTDHRWMDQVDAGGGLVAVASGVLYFLEVAQVAELVDAMARRFPGGRLVYDAESPQMVAASEQAVRERGVTTPMPFRVADPYAPRTWSQAVGDVQVTFDLSSYAPDPAALPPQVRDAFAVMRSGRSLTRSSSTSSASEACGWPGRRRGTSPGPAWPGRAGGRRRASSPAGCPPT